MYLYLLSIVSIIVYESAQCDILSIRFARSSYPQYLNIKIDYVCKVTEYEV